MAHRCRTRGFRTRSRKLDANIVPFLAFVARSSGRTTVLYRRYDGHLGIVPPVW
jgi:hypothetical protein